VYTLSRHAPAAVNSIGAGCEYLASSLYNRSSS